ncbi:MAG: AsmA family protein [Gammaproteobacteria bacterium]|nr:AsmA family protein [Gammaproteobacteria bacterium]
MLKKFTKVSLIILAVIVVLGLSAAAWLAWWFDPNSLRDDIERKVFEKTGRELTIAGDIELNIFPRLHVRIENIVLADDPAFSDVAQPQPMLVVDQATANARLWKYLMAFGRKPIEIGSTHIDGLQANLIKTIDERDNWDALLGDTEPSDIDTSESSNSKNNSVLSIGKVKIDNLTLNYHRRPDQQKVTLSNASLETGAIRSGRSIDFEFLGDVTITDTSTDDALPIQMSADFTGQIADDWQPSVFSIHKADIDLDISEGPQPIKSHRLQIVARELSYTESDYGMLDAVIKFEPLTDTKPLALPLTGTLEAKRLSLTDEQLHASDMIWELSTPYQSQTIPIVGQLNNAYWRRDHDTFEIQLAEGQIGGLPYSLSMIGQLPPNPPTFRGRFDVPTFSPRSVANKIGSPLPATRDPKVYNNASFTGKFVATKELIEFNSFSAALDDSKVAGSLLIDLTKRNLQTTMQVDQVDVDRYLSPPTLQISTSDSGAIRTLSSAPANVFDIDAQLTFDTVLSSGIKARQGALRVRSDNRLWRIHPSRAKLLGGSYEGDIRIDLSGAEPLINVNERFTNINLAAASTKLFGNKAIEGTLSGGLKAKLTGSSSTQWIDSTQGTLSINAHDGRWNGMDLPHEVRKGLAKARNDPEPKPPADPHTPFEKFTGDINIDREKLSSDNLLIRLPYLKLDGQGALNIHSLAIDFVVGARFLDSEELSAAENKWVGHRIPIRIGGTLLAPAVDRGELAKELAVLYAKITLADKLRLPSGERSDKQQQKVDEKQEKIKTEIEEKKEELREDIQDSLRDLFK